MRTATLEELIRYRESKEEVYNADPEGMRHDMHSIDVAIDDLKKKALIVHAHKLVCYPVRNVLPSLTESDQDVYLWLRRQGFDDILYHMKYVQEIPANASMSDRLDACNSEVYNTYCESD